MDKSKKVLHITILDGDEVDTEPIMRAARESGLEKEYFIFLSNKPFGFANREDFAETMRIAMKALRGEKKQVPQNAPNPLFEAPEE